MSYIQEAFNQICQEKKEVQAYYVCLMENVPFYGGSEEGGWWGSDRIVIAYQEFPSEELAETARDAIMELAKKLNQEEHNRYGQQCLNEMEWLDQRGLDDSYLREPDGPSEYYVTVEESMPQNSYGERHYS